MIAHSGAVHPPASPPSLRAEIGRLIDCHGLLPTLAALLASPFRNRRISARAEDLSPHIRRDIGLPPATHTPGHDYWRHL